MATARYGDLVRRLGLLDTDLDAVAKALSEDLPGDTVVTDAQLEAALRKVIGSVDNTSTTPEVPA